MPAIAPANSRHIATAAHFIMAEFLMHRVANKPSSDAHLSAPGARRHGAMTSHRSRRSLPVFSHSCRGQRASLSPTLAASGRRFARPDARRLTCGLATGLPLRSRPRYRRLLSAFHRLATGTARRAHLPRPHLWVQERLLRHEERNVDQCLTAGGVPDRHH
jgi:hypothetical protein